MLSHGSSSMSLLPALKADPMTPRSASVDLSSSDRAWQMKFDALYMGLEPVSSSDLEGVKSAIIRNEENRKALHVCHSYQSCTCLRVLIFRHCGGQWGQSVSLMAIL